MYLIFDRTNNQLVWKNPAPYDKNLQPGEIWHKYDSVKHVIIVSEELPNHIFDGVEYREMKVSEKVEYGVIHLDNDQVLDGEKIRYKTNRERLDDGSMELDDYKALCLEELSSVSFSKRAEILPQYKIDNASLGIYDEEFKSKCQLLVNAFRDEYYRVKEIIDNTDIPDEIDAAMSSVKYPSSMP